MKDPEGAENDESVDAEGQQTAEGTDLEAERRRGLERRSAGRRVSDEEVAPELRTTAERRALRDRRNLAAEILLPGVLKKDD